MKLITKTKGRLFNWKDEFKEPVRDIFKLTIVNNPKVIQGLVSLEVKQDHVYMHLVESAPFNKGKRKMYFGVPGNLVAFACKLSFPSMLAFPILSKPRLNSLLRHSANSPVLYDVNTVAVVSGTQNTIQVTSF